MEDSVVGFQIVREIAHGATEAIPKKLIDVLRKTSYTRNQSPSTATEALYNVVKTADKYDMIHLLRPWVDKWGDEVRLYTHPRADWLGERLWIAWILGHEGMLMEELQTIALSACLVEVLETDDSDQDDAGDDDRVKDNTDNTAQKGHPFLEVTGKAHGVLMLAACNQRGEDVVLGHPDTEENRIFDILLVSGMYHFGSNNTVVSS